MALIGTLRTKMTKFVVGFVALAMGAFIVGSDLFGNGPRSMFSGDKNNVGEIAGKDISREEYQSAIDERENDYALSSGKRPGERERATLQAQAWELLIAQYAVHAQFEKVGVKVTADELWDLVQGKNVDPGIKQSFTDSTGKFDRARVVQYIKGLAITPPTTNQQLYMQWAESKYRWDTYQKNLNLGRERIKYENLLIKSNYVTSAEAERQYHNQNDVAEAKILFVPFFAVSDSAVKVSDSDLSDYYNKNKEKYKSKISRSVSYVVFPVIASSEDSAKVKKDAEKIAADFKTVKDDSTFAVSNSDGSTPYTKYNVSNLPSTIKKDELVTGNVIGPFIDNNAYKIIKVVKAGKDTIYTAKASHILIKWENDTPEKKKEAKDKALKILKEIKGGANFATKARENSADVSNASRGGDLGYFSLSIMVKPFRDAVFAATKTGLLNNVVETQFGYHIIDVTAVKDNSSYTVATIELNIEPSDDTHNTAYLKGQNFASGISGVDAFKEKAGKEQLNVFQANELNSNDQRVNNLGDARKIVTWLFRDASQGKISEVFDLEDAYVVAVMTDESEEGYRSLDKVKDEITPAVRNILKGKIIIEKLNAEKGSLEDLAKAYNDAQINSTVDLKLSSNSVAGAGFDPTVVGRVFSLENGKRSAPFTGENGVIVIDLQNKTIAPEVGDYASYKTELQKNLDNKSSFGIAEAIKDGANIKDKRYKFY